MTPKISVVTVCYNAIDSIEKTIQSVINQTYQNVEYIIIDGGSTDGTVDIIKNYTDHIAYWVSEPDNGIYDAMNKGIANATGDYINFMNAGDFFVNMSVLVDVAANMCKECADVVFGNVVHLLDDSYYEIKARPFYAPPFVKHSMGFNHQCCFVKMEMARRFPFDLKYRLAADYNMIMTIFRNNGTFSHVNKPVAYYDENGISSQQKFMHEKEVFSIESPDARIVNCLELRKRVVVRFIKKIMKSIIIRVAPVIIKRRRMGNIKNGKITLIELSH